MINQRFKRDSNVKFTMQICTLRRGWDLNPRVPFREQRFSGPPRYDHFGTSPIFTTLWALRDLDPRPSGCRPDALTAAPSAQILLYCNDMSEEGLEPSRENSPWILNPSCLPIPALARNFGDLFIRSLPYFLFQEFLPFSRLLV